MDGAGRGRGAFCGGGVTTPAARGRRQSQAPCGSGLRPRTAFKGGAASQPRSCPARLRPLPSLARLSRAEPGRAGPGRGTGPGQVPVPLGRGPAPPCAPSPGASPGSAAAQGPGAGRAGQRQRPRPRSAPHSRIPRQPRPRGRLPTSPCPGLSPLSSPERGVEARRGTRLRSSPLLPAPLRSSRPPAPATPGCGSGPWRPAGFLAVAALQWRKGGGSSAARLPSAPRHLPPNPPARSPPRLSPPKPCCLLPLWLPARPAVPASFAVCRAQGDALQFGEGSAPVLLCSSQGLRLKKPRPVRATSTWSNNHPAGSIASSSFGSSLFPPSPGFSAWENHCFEAGAFGLGPLGLPLALGRPQLHQQKLTVGTPQCDVTPRAAEAVPGRPRQERCHRELKALCTPAACPLRSSADNV